MVGVVMFLNWTTQTEPVVSRWQTSVKHQTDIYADTAAQIFEYEGETGLRTFLDRIRRNEFIGDIGLANEKGEILYLNEKDNPILPKITAQAFNSQTPELDFTAPNAGFSAKSFALSGGERYVLITRWERPKPTPVFGESRLRYARLLGLLITALLVCYIFARYLSSPIVKLSEAAKQLAAGNLQTRVYPKIGKRRDEISKLAKDFDEMAERIESLISSQKRLSRDVSHELRSPLSRLNVALELAKQKSVAETQPLLDRIEREAKQLNEMISQILTLSRLESQSETIEKRQVNLSRLVEKVVADANFEAESKGKKVVILENEPSEISGNENLLRSAIENVLRNAVRYTDEIVEVSLTKNKTASVVKIRDYGEGVPEAELSQLFKPFHRVAEARERKTGGVGLGLAIAEQAVQSHKGEIKARNAEDKGLTVEIKLPHQNS